MPLNLKETDVDWFVCQCGNNPSRDGFYTCHKNGDFAEPSIDGPWDGKSYVCTSCFAIYDIDTFDQVGIASLESQKKWRTGVYS